MAGTPDTIPQKVPTTVPQSSGWAAVAQVPTADLNGGSVDVDFAAPLINGRPAAGYAVALIPLDANGAPVAPAGTFNADPTALIPLPLGEAPVVFPGLAAVPAAEAGLVQDIPTVQARWRLALAGAGLAGVDTLVVVAPLR